MKQALKVSIENKYSNCEQMKTIARVYSSNRECSVQKAVHHCLPELWFWKVFPCVIYANTNFPEKRFRVLRYQKDLPGDLPVDSDDIFKGNMLERYLDRPDESFFDGRYGVLNKFCHAEFLRFYYIVQSANENDRQPMELKEELLEVNSPAPDYRIVISLIFSKEKMKCRKLSSVLQYFTPNKNRDYESYAHHLLLLFYPFRDESDLKVGIPPSYTNEIAEPGVIDIINTNRALVEPFSDAVGEALLQYSQTEMNNVKLWSR